MTMDDGWVSTDLGNGVWRVGPIGSEIDAPMTPEDYDVGPGGCAVCYILAPVVDGTEPEIMHCPNRATTTAFGVTVCPGDRHWATVDAWAHTVRNGDGNDG